MRLISPCLGSLSPVILALGLVAGLVASGCSQSEPVSPTPALVPTPSVSSAGTELRAMPEESIQDASESVPDATTEGVAGSDVSDLSAEAQSEAAEAGEAEPATPVANPTAPTQGKRSVPTPSNSERAKGLGQFGGGFGGGGFGGGGGGFGGGGGGGLGGLGGGGLGGGGGGVSIDPKIQLKADSSGKLQQRRQEAAAKKPSKGSFSAD